jgi:hypothetical protein
MAAPSCPGWQGAIGPGARERRARGPGIRPSRTRLAHSRALYAPCDRARERGPPSPTAVHQEALERDRNMGATPEVCATQSKPLGDGRNRRAITPRALAAEGLTAHWTSASAGRMRVAAHPRPRQPTSGATMLGLSVHPRARVAPIEAHLWARDPGAGGRFTRTTWARGRDGQGGSGRPARARSRLVSSRPANDARAETPNGPGTAKPGAVG